MRMHAVAPAPPPHARRAADPRAPQKPGGVRANALDLRTKNLANTNVVYWNNTLLALYEACLPYQVRWRPATGRGRLAARCRA